MIAILRRRQLSCPSLRIAILRRRVKLWRTKISRAKLMKGELC